MNRLLSLVCVIVALAGVGCARGAATPSPVEPTSNDIAAVLAEVDAEATGSVSALGAARVCSRDSHCGRGEFCCAKRCARRQAGVRCVPNGEPGSPE